MYRKSVKIALVLVYLVIIAGAVVRMTGSGMGCPDWPKCFGYWIPPTEASALAWQPNTEYEAGQVIIREESLQVASSDFISGEAFAKANWEQYDKHDYAIFNPWHTWIEYINRLLGALAGLVVLVMAVLSFSQWRLKRRIVYLSWLAVVMMGFQGWLGATVVYSVLAPVRITIHMVMALLIVALLIYLLYTSRMQLLEASFSSGRLGTKYDRPFKYLVLLALILTLIQIIMGTQVRQFVDERIDQVGYAAKSLWLNDPEVVFYLHRSFSILVLLLNLFLFMRNKKRALGYSLTNWVLLLLGLEILSGTVMYYFDFPFTTQPVHLIVAALLFGVQFYLLLETFPKRDAVKA
ncbi:COX15/CtaA family protein [Croceiramulus getboli]|nr:COX15/CtaA family protein [Flavobacteriaceae bacterium YJPT1-3]